MDRDESRDRSAVVRHSHSFDRGPHVPMWDSSDPERAPPPLPLNPNPSSPTPVTRPNTSTNIAAAAQALADKARESAGPAAYTTNPMPERSPERSLIKGAAHRRLQSLQTGSVRDIRSFLDGNRTPDRSPERPSRSATPACKKEKDSIYGSSPEKTPSRSRSSTPTPRDSLKESSSMRRSTPKPILGENTPPSATMLALQTMTVRDFQDTPLGSITNGSTNSHAPQNFEAISSQILSLTTIATNLQREMAQLSRRSKDNATDLISLKEATNSRDEDIRKSLRQLLNTVSAPSNNTANTASAPTTFAPTGFATVPRPASAFTSSSTPPPGGAKSFSLPRIPSPGSLFDERAGSPNPFSVEGAASVAMLEKIIREMVTKEGQERLLGTLNQLFEKSSKESGHTAKKVAELVEFIKDGPGSRALVCGPGNEQPRATSNSFEATISGPLTLSSRDVQPLSPGAGGDGQKTYSSPKAADFVSDEVIKLLKKIKDGVFHSGGVTNEVKAQQRDLRGEVLHMGRDLARKIDEARKPAGNAKAIEDGSGKQDIARIINEGLADLKTHLDEVMREKRRQSSSSSISRTSVDNREVYDVVKHALTERGLDRFPPAQTHQQSPPLDKEAILEAVKEAYESYRPEIELQQFGLERDEILQCLKEGLEEHRSIAPDSNAISRAEILETIHEAMQNFTPPRPINEAHETRDEMLSAVRECLDELKPSLVRRRSATSNRELDVTREVVYDAVKAGLASNGPHGSRAIEINGEDLFHAVKAALEVSGNPLGHYGQEVTLRLQDLLGELREQFKSYSAANGRDTEQVLDAMKDGLESLRAEIEQYVDRSQDVTGKDEIIDTVRNGLDHLRVDVEEFCAAGPQGDRAFSRAEMLNYMKAEFGQLQDAIAQIASSGSSGNHTLVMNALRAGFETIKSNAGTRGIGGMSGEVSEAMREELEQLRDIVITRSGGYKDEVIDTVQAGFDNINAKLARGNLSASGDEVLKAINEEFEHLRSTVANSMVRSTEFDGKDEIIDSVQNSLNDLKDQLLGSQGNASMPLLQAIRVEFDRLNETLGSNSLAQAAGSGNNQEVMMSLRSTLDAIREASGTSSMDSEMLEAIRGEFEVLRASVANGLARTSSKADFEEIHDAIRLGLDDLRSHLEKKMDNPDRQMAAHSEFLDAINEGLDSLKTDIAKSINKPIDMTVSYEILDTLKEGISSLREDFEKLKGHKGSSEMRNRSLSTPGNELVLVEDSEEGTENAPLTQVKATDLLNRNDLEKMEVMLAQLQVKVEAMDANINDFPQQPPQPVTGTAMKTDLSTIEELLKDMRASMDLIASHDFEAEKLAKKEDVDAIETLLRNTKDKLDDIQLPDSNTSVSREQVDAFEMLVKSTREAIDDLGVEMKDNIASKQDVTLVEVLVQDLKAVMDEIKEGKQVAAKEEEEARSTEIDALKLLSLEIKEKLLEMKAGEADGMPSKADIELLTGLIQEFRDSHDKLKDRYEDDIGVTAKAFDDRKQEAIDIITSIGLVKSFLEDVKDELKAKVESTGVDVSILSENVKGLEETIAANFSISGDVKELMETVTREFERVSGLVENVQQEQDQKTMSAEEKHEEVRAAVIAEICSKVDERFDALISKYDDAQIDAVTHIKAMEEKSSEQEDILVSTRNVAEELKISIDTLGATVTGMEDTFKDLASRVSDDSKAVFGKVDEGFSKLEEVETRAAAKEEHQQTRDHVFKAVTALDALHSDVAEYHPKFMVTLQGIQALITQHYEHSQKAQEMAQERYQETSEVSRSMTEEIKSNFSMLPALLPAPGPAIEEAVERYDDAPVQAKLDKLITLLDGSKDAFGQLDRLDNIHQQVIATATEVSAFVSTQNRLITEGHESKEQEAGEIALLLERRLAQKEHVEKDVEHLNDEKDSLLAIISELRADRDSLVSQKAKLANDVSALQTALHIRKEELHDMDLKADALERRILEGIMDQSRALLLAKGMKAATLGNVKQRNLSNASHSTLGALPPSAASQALNMAIKNRSSPARRNVPPGLSPASRRIMSLNQISHNTPTGARGYKAANTGFGTGLGSGLLKRSQSVRSQGLRKISWNDGVDKRRAVSGAIEEDKENAGLGDIHDVEEPHDDDADDAASTGTVTITERESGMSYATSMGYADSVMTSDRSEFDDRRTSSGSEYTYATGSYITGTDLSRRSSQVGTVNEESEGDESASDAETDAEAGTESVVAESEEENEHTPVPEESKVILFRGPADLDSGLGSDVPTAGGLSGDETDYFRRAAEEAASSVGG